MTVVRFDIKDTIGEALLRYENLAEEVIDQALTATALAIQSDAKKRIQRGEKSGQIYEKYKPRRTHQASAPGESPASDTGRLANSITFESLGPTIKRVGSILPYANWLEFGTLKMGERPFLRPAVDSKRKGLPQRIAALMRQGNK